MTSVTTARRKSESDDGSASEVGAGGGGEVNDGGASEDPEGGCAVGAVAAAGGDCAGVPSSGGA
jgi:hypothetical protein